jgi:hypothetical protein
MTGLSKLERNLPRVKLEITQIPNRILSKRDLTNQLEALQDEGVIGEKTRVDSLIDLLTTEKTIRPIILKGQTDLDRYIIGEVNELQIALSVASLTYISHATALIIKGLIPLNFKKIFITQEQSVKPSIKITLRQEDIDTAFSKPQRPTKSIYEWGGHKIYLLKGKYSGNLGLIHTNYKASQIFTTDIERSILDITVRPAHTDGVKNVIEAYRNVKGKISVRKLFDYLQKMKFVYPYHQAIGFYLEYAGYKVEEIELFRNLPKNFNFYLDYNLEKRVYNPKWRIYTPEL